MRSLFTKFVFAGFFSVSALLGAESGDNTILAGTAALFGKEPAPPVSLYSNKGWTLLSAVNWEDIAIAPTPEGSSRNWRIRSSYEHDAAGVPVTLQVRLRGISAGNSAGPTFTHPWSEGADRQTESYSNWFKEDLFLDKNGRGYLEARLVAPPRTPLSGTLFGIVLEAWDSSETPQMAPSGQPQSNVQLAYAAPLPTARIDPRAISKNSPADSRTGGQAYDSERGTAAALDFSLSFVESCLTGDLPSFYRSLADPVRVLDDGSALAKYRVSPPTMIPGVQDIENYKHRFRFSVYPMEKYRELFPEWFDTKRDWTPPADSYLFMGHQDRLGNQFPEGVDYLVFLAAVNDDGEWKVIARPGN